MDAAKMTPLDLYLLGHQDAEGGREPQSDDHNYLAGHRDGRGEAPSLRGPSRRLGDPEDGPASAAATYLSWQY